MTLFLACLAIYALKLHWSLYVAASLVWLGRVLFRVCLAEYIR